MVFNIKILSVNLNPFVKTYMHHALPISAITEMNKDNDLFVINNFIQVRSQDNNPLYLGYFINYFEKWFCIHSQFFGGNITYDNEIDAVPFFQKLIDSNWYSYIILNLKYIPYRWCYLKEDFFHEILLHGYDESNFYVLGYCDDGKYDTIKVTYEDFRKAFIERSLVVALRKNPDYEPKLDIRVNLELLTDYLESIDTAQKYRLFLTDAREDFDWGISAFYKLSENVSNTQIQQWDFFYQHKRLMSARVDSFSQLTKVDDLQSHFYKLEAEALAIKNLYLKFTISPNLKTADRISDKTISLLKTEKDLLIDFIGRIKTVIQ